MWGKLGRMGESIFRRRTAEVEKQFVEAFTRACQAQQAGEALRRRWSAPPATVAPEPVRVAVDAPTPSADVQGGDEGPPPAAASGRA